MFIFGENKAYFIPFGKKLIKLKLFLNKIKIPGVFPLSKIPFFPNTDCEINMVVGKSI